MAASLPVPSGTARNREAITPACRGARASGLNLARDGLAFAAEPKAVRRDTGELMTFARTCLSSAYINCFA